MTRAPAVSVVLAVRHPHPVYFAPAVRSILDQSLSDLELIIVEDDGADAMPASIADSRLQHVRGSGGGLAAALNQGIELARAPLIARIDADDLALPHRLQRQVEFLADHGDVAVVGSRIAIIDAMGAVIGHRRLPLAHRDIAAAMRRYNCLSHPSVLFRREAIVDAGGYRRGIRAEDYDLWCRLLLRGHRFANLAEELTRYRFHPAALKVGDVHEEIRATIRIKREHFGTAFSLRDRARIIGELALLMLPQPLIVWLFQKLQYD